MFSTTEVRWFHKGNLSLPALAWFESCPGDWQEQLARTDYYLLNPDSDALGIKLREGRLELKQRLLELGVANLHDHVWGLLERWQKWSFVLAGTPSILQEINRPESVWLAMHKQRKLRRYRFDHEAFIEPVPVDHLPLQGCTVELTNVRCADQAWWSLAFEAYGTETSSREILVAVARQLFEGHEAPVLAAVNSYGYPRWLARLKH